MKFLHSWCNVCALRSKPRQDGSGILNALYRGAIVDVGRLIRTELQLSMRRGTSDITSCNITFWITEL